MNRKVLGRGLEALITSESQQKEYIDYVDIAKIKPNRYQPREEFNKQKLDELVSSIREKGVIQPILIRPNNEDGYELIAGERRLRAARFLGYSQIPAVIKDVDDTNTLELSLIENIQREELNPIEEASAYQRLIDEFNFTQEMVGQAVGKDRASIANGLRLLSLPKKIKDLLSKHLLSAGHAKVLLSIENADAQIALSKKVVKNGLSVRALEKIIRKKRRVEKSPVVIDNDIRLIEEKVQERLGTKVRIRHGKKRGTILIDYYSEEDLVRILKVMDCA